MNIKNNRSLFAILDIFVLGFFVFWGIISVHNLSQS